MTSPSSIPIENLLQSTSESVPISDLLQRITNLESQLQNLTNSQANFQHNKIADKYGFKKSTVSSHVRKVEMLKNLSPRIKTYQGEIQGRNQPVLFIRLEKW